MHANCMDYMKTTNYHMGFYQELWDGRNSKIPLLSVESVKGHTATINIQLKKFTRLTVSVQPYSVTDFGCDLAAVI